MSAEWLPDFFSGGNQIDFTKVMAGEFGVVYQKMMEPLIHSVSENRWPIILPFNDSRLCFYCAGQDERMLLELRRVLAASLGSADTDPELPIVKHPSNSSEEILLTHAPSGVIKVTMLESAQNDMEAKKRVFNALKRVLFLYEQRPELSEEIRRPVGRILREFFTACQASDGQSAEELYQELRNNGTISQRNLLFLEFQALGAGQHWEAVVTHEKLGHCLGGRLPLQVTRLLLKALSHSRLDVIYQSGFSRVELEQVRGVCQNFLPLFAKPPFGVELHGITNEWKAWAIGAAALGFKSIARYVPDGVEPSWLHDLFTWADIEEQGDVGEQEETKDELTGPLDLKRVQALLQRTLLASSEETKEIVVALSQMSETLSEHLQKLPKLYQYWMSLQQEDQAQDYGWLQWFTDVTNNHDQADTLRQLAMSDSQHWPASSFDAVTIQTVLEEGNNEQIGEIVRDIIPVMLIWLEERGIICQDRFWVKLLELLALDDIANSQDVRLTLLLLERLLSGSYSVEHYEEALQAVEMLLEKVSSTRSYVMIMELMDLLLENPCPSTAAQQALWSGVQQFALQKWHRLSSLEQLLTRFTAREIIGDGVEAVFDDIVNLETGSDEKTDEQVPDLVGKMLGIYSLTEGAARRAKDILLGMYTGLTIQINNDHVATSALKNLAKKAEYFVFASSSAKHQAFYTVTHIRSDLIYPKGKGASSIVKAFVEIID